MIAPSSPLASPRPRPVRPRHATALAVAIVVAAVAALPARAQAQDASATDEMRKRLDEIERSMKAQTEAQAREILELRKKLAEQEALLKAQKEAIETQEQAIKAQEGAIQKQEAATADLREKIADELLFENNAGGRQTNEEGDPLENLPRVGEDLKGNVYSAKNFKIKLGGSLRLHAQHNSTPVPESVSKALLPDPLIPSGGDEEGRESFRAFAARSRINLAVQGPDTLGGQTLGFFEMDFAQNFSGGEAGAITTNPRLRHAYMRWTFRDIFTATDELIFTMGQTGSSADLIPDTVDFNTMLAGLGAVHRRNPRFEVVHRFDLSEDWRFAYGLGVERPFFGNDFIANDLGPGDLSGYPAFSAGLGIRNNGRIGGEEGFGVNLIRLFGRGTYGEFEERFEEGTLNPNLKLEQNFDEREFQNIAAHGGLVLEGIGFNAKGRALTLNIMTGGVYTQGDALHLDASFDRRTILDSDGDLDEAESVGGFVATSFFILQDLSVRWAGGGQFALDADRPPVTGAFTSGYFRTQNLQSEVSIWWTPGPFTFAIAWNHTNTDYRNIDPTTGARDSETNHNDKFEFISWFSF